MLENPFVGVWELVSCVAARKDGGALPIYGKCPIGRLYYDSAGNMSVHIMKAGRPKFKRESKFGATLDEMRTAYEGYEAYFSTYQVDQESRIINHRVIGGLFPNWAGTVQSRHYQFEGDNRLVLSSEAIGSGPADKTVVTLVWERLS
jgi:hypothetical protein